MWSVRKSVNVPSGQFNKSLRKSSIVTTLAAEGDWMLKALVLMPNEKTSEVASLLAVARDAARKREESSNNPPIRALHFIAELKVFVAIY
jgi:hypothetical protein